MKTWASVIICRAVLFGLFLLGTSIINLGQQPVDRTFSENRKFSVDLTAGEPGKVNLTVMKQEGTIVTMVWSKAVDWELPGWGGFTTHYVQKTITDDGATVILRDKFAHGAVNGLAVHTKSAGKMFSEAELRIITDFRLPQNDRQVYNQGSLLFAQGALELMPLEEASRDYALWIPAVKKWVVVNLDTLTISVPEGEAAKKLDDRALTMARDLASGFQPDGIKRGLQSLREKAAELIPGMSPGSGNRNFLTPEKGAAFYYLAHRKIPSDKEAIKKLLDAPINQIGANSVSFGGGEVRIFSGSPERALGDRLMTEWEGKTNESQRLPTGQFAMDEAFTYLGAVEGTVELAIPVPEKAGALWIFLAPVDTEADELKDHPDVAVLAHDFAMNRGARNQDEAISEIQFKFGAITPGTYKLKALWDRRKPQTPVHSGERAEPEPGDYISGFSTNVTVAAGKTAGEIVLPCTNRVGEAEEYYAADELWKEKHEEILAEREDTGQSGDKTVFTAPIVEWAEGGIVENAGFKLRRISLVEPGHSYLGARTALNVSVLKPQGNEDYYNAEIVDEHGCEQKGDTQYYGGRTVAFQFTAFPRDKKGWEIRIKGQTDAIVAKFKVNNLLKVEPAEWSEDALPARKELDLVTVELTRIAYSMPQFKFINKEGKITKRWNLGMIYYEDRWGNRASSMDGLCRMEELVKIESSFTRTSNGDFSDDEKWVIPVEMVPKEGAYVPLDARKELQGIDVRLVALAGTGEFTYRDEEVVETKSEWDPEARPSRFAASHWLRDQKVFVKDLPGMMPPGVNRGQKQTVVSKVPHLALKKRFSEGENSFMVVEQDSPRGGIVTFHGASTFSRVEFLPLKLEPGATNQTLTIIAQKPRRAEFIVKLPKRPKSNPGLNFDFPASLLQTE